MGREIRRVPQDWEHPVDRNRPRNRDGSINYISLSDGFNQRLAGWREEKAQWAAGLARDWSAPWPTKAWKPRDRDDEFEDERPCHLDFMPDWPAEERTHLQMYETTSEGTPISPPMATPEELARWLADNGASAFGDSAATYEQWLATCLRGSAPSAVFSPATGLVSGVEALADNPA